MKKIKVAGSLKLATDTMVVEKAKLVAQLQELTQEKEILQSQGREMSETLMEKVTEVIRAGNGKK